MREFATSKIGAASAHGVKLFVRWEIDASHANGGAWQIRTRLPLRRLEEAIYRWVFLYRRRASLPLSQCKGNSAHRHQHEQVKRASNRACFSRGVNALLHFPCVPLRKPLLLEARQRCRDFSCEKTYHSLKSPAWS